MTRPSQGHGEGGIRRWAAALAILFVGASCADEAAPRRAAPTTSAATPVVTEPAVATERGSRDVGGSSLTAEDDGRVVSLRAGESADLILAAPVVAEPVASGDALELVATDNLAGSDVRQWEVRAITPGTAVIEAEDAQDGVRITVVVRQ